MGNYLITGGGGFIGSHVADALISYGHSLVILDDLSTGSDKNVNSKATFYNGSITDSKFVCQVFSEHQFDGVIHEASHINTSVPKENPKLDLGVNVEGTINLMDAVIENKSGKFIYASSVSVYGSPSRLPASEMCPTQPIYSYGIAKQCAEEYVKYYGANRGLDYHIARYANIYGPRQPIYGEVGVIAIFAQNVLNQENITVFGNGEYIRDFLHIDDTVEATMGLLNLAGSDTFNVGSGKASSVNEIIKAFETAIGQPLEIEYKPERPNELGNFFSDNTKLCSALNWAPKIDLLSGVRSTLDFSRGV